MDIRERMKSSVCWLFIFMSILVGWQSRLAFCQKSLDVLQRGDLRILYSAGLRQAAQEILKAFPEIESDLERSFDWAVKGGVTIILIKRSERFEQMSGNKNFLAFAVPQRHIIVIDQSRTSRSAVIYEGTVRHELCHLILHDHVTGGALPRWLGEGVCQWISDGISEMMAPEKSLRSETLLQAGRAYPFAQLARRFPSDTLGLQLAYEQSKNYVEYIVGRFGKSSLIELLHLLAAGKSLNGAFQQAFSIPPQELEKQWRNHLQSGWTVLLLVSAHLYELLFFVGALATVWGFIRRRKKKRAFDVFESDDGDDFTDTK